MITKLYITNFQAHRSLVVPLSKGVVSIVGSSDVGKSAVIRALRWLVFNRPAGNAFINWDKPGATAAVSVDVGDKTVTRAKSRGTNLYTIDDQEYAAFGNDVPPDVTKLLNLSDINFQAQHDSPFWFSETAGEVSRQLNQIIDLSIIDSTLANIASALRTARTEVELTKGRLEQAVEERGRLKYARQMDEQLTVVEGLSKDADEIAVKRARIDSLLGDARNYAQASELAAQGNVAANSALIAGEKWAGRMLERQELQNLVANGLEQQTAARIQVPNTKPVELAFRQWNDCNENLTDLKVLVFNLMEQEKELCQLTEQHRTSATQLTKLMGRVCPLCGAKTP